MKIKSLAIIFILFLLIALTSGTVAFLTKEKNVPAAGEQTSLVETQAESASIETIAVATSTKEKIVQSKKTEQPTIFSVPAEEKIKVELIIQGVKYEAAIKPDSSAYDLMDKLKKENKINFSGKNYSDLGFFVEEINGLKNNPSGENWVYYINNQPAQVGVSYYVVKENDVIEWKYEKKSF